MLQDRSVELLYSLPLFTGWDPVALQAIAYVNTRLFLAPGETLLAAGEDAPGATLIISGMARASEEMGEQAVRQYGPGSCFDEMAMFIATRSEQGIVAETPLEVLRISRDRMQDILHNDPAMAAVLAGRIQGRLLGIVDRLRAVSDMLGPADESGEDEEDELEEAREDLAGDAQEREAVTADADRTPQEPEHDRTDAPSPAPRRQPASNGTPRPEAASPRHGPAVAPGLTGASPVHGNSTT